MEFGADMIAMLASQRVVREKNVVGLVVDCVNSALRNLDGSES